MGFKNNAFATVWTIEPVSDVMTKARISISKKNRQTGAYEADFSGFVAFVGKNAAQKAITLKEKDRIKLGDVDCRTHYDEKKKITYYNFNIFSFEMADEANPNHASKKSPEEFDPSNIPNVDDGEINSDEYPF